MFLLTETVDRETEVALFSTREAAQKAMNKLYEAVIEDEDDNIEECGTTDNSAWINTYSDYNYDWSIIDLDGVDENSLHH